MTMATLDSTQFNQLVQEVREALLTGSQGVGELEVADSLDDIVSLPALRRSGSTESVVEAPIDLLSAPAVEAADDAREAAEDARKAAEDVAAATQRAQEASDEAEAATEDARTATEDAIAAKAGADAAAESAREQAAGAGTAATEAQQAASDADDATARALAAEQRAIDAAKAAEGIVSDIRPDWQETDKAGSSYIANKPEIPTLSAAPEAATLTYVNSDGNEVAFRIGDEVRVADAASDEGYVFYKLYDLADGAAVWSQAGSGGSPDMREKVHISLSSNQSQPDASLIGAAVTVTDTTLEQVVLDTVWDGQELLARVTASSDYTVAVGDVEGYATPAAQTFTASAQGERNVEMAYNACLLTVTLDSNQADKGDISPAKATVSYGAKSMEVPSGGSVKVPAGSDVTVTASDVAHYATPAAQTFTANTASKDVTMVYNACALTVTVAGVDGTLPDVTVVYGSVSRTVASGGTLNVPYGKQVTVSCPEVSGYGKPSDVTFIPSSASKEVTMEYGSSLLKVTIGSNQADKADISGLQVTVSYGGTSVKADSGATVPIPVGEQVTVSFPALDGYRKPDDIVLTSTGGLVEKSVTYETEVVTVSVTADNGTSMAGQTVSIAGTEYTYQGAPISVKVPFGTYYTVYVNSRSGYTKPDSQSMTASQASRSIAMIYAYDAIKYSVVTLDQTVTDPAAMLSGDINGEAVQLIRQNSHRVLGKFTADGKMAYCRLKDDDSAKYYDGTDAVLTTTGVDVFMKLPRFFWKVETESTDVFKIRLAYGGEPAAGLGYQEWDGNTLIGAFKGYADSSKLYSRAGVQPLTNASQSNCKAYARARGDGYQIVDYNMHCMMAMLFYCMYGHMNSQAKVGAGTSSSRKTAGGTKSYGMTDTVAGGNGDSDSINFWGLENWWGDMYEWMEGIEFGIGNIATITMPDGKTRNVECVALDNTYTQKMVLGKYFDMIASEGGATTTTGYCDSYRLSFGSTVLSVVPLRSYNAKSVNGGVAYMEANSAASTAKSNTGSRLAFRGELVEADSVAAFKAIEVTN